MSVGAEKEGKKDKRSCGAHQCVKHLHSHMQPAPSYKTQIHVLNRYLPSATRSDALHPRNEHHPGLKSTHQVEYSKRTRGSPRLRRYASVEMWRCMYVWIDGCVFFLELGGAGATCII